MQTEDSISTQSRAEKSPFQTERTSLATVLESRTKGFINAINARDFDPPTSNSDHDPSPWTFLHTTFRADLSGILSRASIDLSHGPLPLPPSDGASIDGRELVDLFAYTAAEFPAYRMNFGDATTCLNEERGSVSVFVNINVVGSDKEGEGDGDTRGRLKGSVRSSVGEFE